MTKKSGFILVLIISSLVYFSAQVNTVYGGDAGDFLAAVATKGIPHPPGYPLYTLLAILATNAVHGGTLAYKVGFLSTIPGVLTLLFLFLFLAKVSGKIYAALISIFIIGFSYPIFLYSVTVEVFSLNNVFFSALIYFSYSFYKTAKIKYFYLCSYLIGLAFTHHHIIVFILPCLIYLTASLIRKVSPIILIKACAYFLCGLLPYYYVFISSFKYPSVNWMGEPNLINFINLVLRTTYGTFTAGSFINQNILSRFLNVFGFIELVIRDFSPIPVTLILAGTYYLFRQNKKIFKYFLINFFSYVFLLFYASFPLTDNFMIATFERYLLPLYLLFSIPLCFGFIFSEVLLEKFLKKMSVNLKQNSIKRLILSTFIFLPLFLLYKNYLIIAPLKNDTTAENFGKDILEATGKKGLLFLSLDTSLFDTQYIYYSQNRKSPALIHFSKLYLPDYIKQLNRDYPDLNFKQPISEKYGFDGMLKDLGDIEIYSKQSFETESGKWVPWGLVYKYLPDGIDENPERIIDENEKLWEKINNPEDANSYKFRNLFLADVLKWLMLSRQEIALYEVRNSKAGYALKHLEIAKSLNPSDLDSYIILSQIYIKDKKCSQAEFEIEDLEKLAVEDNTVNFLKYLNASICKNNQEEANKWLLIYGEKEKKKETPLKKL